MGDPIDLPLIFIDLLPRLLVNLLRQHNNLIILG